MILHMTVTYITKYDKNMRSIKRQLYIQVIITLYNIKKAIEGSEANNII